MLFNEFTKYVKREFEDYYSKVHSLQSKSNIHPPNATILYPTLILFTQYSDYFSAELLGATKKFSGLTQKVHKEKSIYRYFSQFDESYSDYFIGVQKVLHLQNLILGRGRDKAEVANRFKNINYLETGIYSGEQEGIGSIFFFGDKFERLSIDNCILVNKQDNNYRCKSILSFHLFKSSVSKNYIKGYFESYFFGNIVKAVHSPKDAKKDRIILGGQLQNLFLIPNIKETTIGQFLKDHPETVKLAFNSDHFEYEPYLEWIQHDGTCRDSAINPDLLVQREDGYYDIYDLKTALSYKDSLTKGRRSRRRFIDYVEEGVAQLFNYKEYFTFKENAEHAQRKYNISVNNPKLVLIVGCWDNFDAEEVRQATRRYNDVDIIDYDTFCHMFIGAI